MYVHNTRQTNTVSIQYFGTQMLHTIS